jgi:tRNA-binding protein
MPGTITLDEFLRADLRVGTVRSAALNPKARKPAYVLKIDFGPLGLRTSSAQLTERYAAEDLVGRQVVAVVNFPPKRVAGVTSEVLVLGAVDDEVGTTLLAPTHRVADGTRVA